MSTESNIDAVREYYETHSVADKIENAVAGDPANTSPMSGYSVRLPTEVLNRARELAAERGMTTGAWMRETIEKQIAAGRSERDDAAAALAVLLGLITQHWSEAYNSRDSALIAALAPVLVGLKADLLRDRNAAHLRNLGVDALIAGAGMDSWIAPPAVHSESGNPGTTAEKKKRTVKVRSSNHLFTTAFVRNGHTVRIKDAAPAARRRRRSSL